MKCPHCLTSIHQAWNPLGDLGEDHDHAQFAYLTMKCPECERHILRKEVREKIGSGRTRRVIGLLYPRSSGRPSPPTEVPEPFAQDYREACLVFDDSPKASAALSRRCLQAILREKTGVKPSSLSNEIDEAMPKLPGYLAGAIDGVRNIGNFAAHPIKSDSTGEVIDVEPGEAEWLLDTLEGLFAFYFVEPAALERKREELNAKLADAGKPPVKEPPADDA
jgi:Domain of unknown function (DUF4145)